MAKTILLKQRLLDKDIIPMQLCEAAVLAGEIFVDGKPAHSLGQKIPIESVVQFISQTPQYVSRGGHKLAAALQTFSVSVEGLVCADFGSSIGGFTDALLQAGARHVYAIERGKNQLDTRLVQHDQVTQIEGKSLFQLEALPHKVDLAVCDLSFIPLKNAIPKIMSLTHNAPLIALLKPHYEAANPSVLRNGKVKDADTRQQIVDTFLQWVVASRYVVSDLCESPVRGGGRNIEYLVRIILAQ